MEIVKSYSLYLNSREANTGNSNNCTFIFTTPIVLTNTNNRFLISTPMIELPYSFSQVNTTNYTLPYTYTDGTGSYTSTTMNIPEGNYNITQYLTQLATSLVADIKLAGHRPSSTITTAAFLFTYSAQTGLTTLGATFSTPFQIQFNFVIAYVQGLMLGFPAINSSASAFGTGGSYAGTITSPNKVMVNPITSVYLRSDTLKFQSNYEAIVQTYNNSDILAKVPVTTLPNSIIYYRNDIKSMISNKFIPSLNLYWSDNLSTLYQLDLQGVNYGIMIQFDEVMLKPTNAYKDTIGAAVAAPPKELVAERDRLLADLLAKKEALEKEIEAKRAANQAEVRQIENKNNLAPQ
jgi:hypothetical protein